MNQLAQVHKNAINLFEAVYPGNGTDFADWEKMLDRKSGEDAIAYFARHGSSIVDSLQCNIKTNNKFSSLLWFW